jgi:UDP-GlcNAc:undecaprenyl-phosphate/decaprenyl-phosphate GlcNAc-1-phosphate transferase
LYLSMQLGRVSTDLAALETVQRDLMAAVLPSLVALAIALALVPLAIVLARRFGFMAYPRGARDIHTRAVPYGGGLAMFAAFAIAGLVFLPHTPKLLGVIALAGVAAIFFAVDDRLNLPAFSKLAVNVGLALAAIEVFGLHIDFLFLGFLRVHDLGLLILPVTLFWIIGMQNTVNLLDGVDGLAAGVVAIVAMILMIAAAGKLGVVGQRDVLILCGILAAACVGFLVFNFHPARIFMGDSGSQFLGTALALLSILGVAKVSVVAALLLPVLALALPIVDTAWAIVRRRRRGLSIAHADSMHVHHLLLKFGLTQPETCVVFYGATGILGAIGLSVYGHKRILAAAIVFMVVIVSTVLGERLQLWNRRLPVPGGRILRLALQGRQPKD